MKLEDAYLEVLVNRLDAALAEQEESATPLEPFRPSCGTVATPSTTTPTVVCEADDVLEAACRSASWQKPETEVCPDADVNAVTNDVHERDPAEFWPLAPHDWDEMRVSPGTGEELVLKCLRNRGTASGRELTDHLAVPFGMLSQLLEQMKAHRLIGHKGSAQFGDYIYQLTADGLETAADCRRPGNRRAARVDLCLRRIGASCVSGLHRQRAGPIGSPLSAQQRADRDDLQRPGAE